MPYVPGTKFTFEFDSHGRLRLMNDEQAQMFLEHVSKSPQLDIFLGIEPIPNYTASCLRNPPPLKETGCANDICPFDLRLRVTPAVQVERQRLIEEMGGGGV